MESRHPNDRGQENDDEEAKKPIHHNRKRPGQFRPGSEPENVIEAHHIASDQTRKKDIEEQADDYDRARSQPAQGNPLNPQQQMPADRCHNFDTRVADASQSDPRLVGTMQRAANFGTLTWILEDIQDRRSRYGCLQENEQNASQHSFPVSGFQFPCPFIPHSAIKSNQEPRGYFRFSVSGFPSFRTAGSEFRLSSFPLSVFSFQLFFTL